MSKSPNRILATVVGAVYLVIGALGFTATSGVGFFSTEGGLLLGIFEVNPFHNVTHLVIGAALLIAALSNVRASRTVNVVIGVVYLLLGLVGLFIVGSPFNILALNVPDHALHFASAALLLAVGLGADKSTRPSVA